MYISAGALAAEANEMSSVLGGVSNQLASCSGAINRFCNDSTLSGAAIDSAKIYYNQVYTPLINGLRSINAETADIANSLVPRFNGYVPDTHGFEVDTDLLNDEIDRLTIKKNNYITTSQNYAQMAASASYSIDKYGWGAAMASYYSTMASYYSSLANEIGKEIDILSGIVSGALSYDDACGGLFDTIMAQLSLLEHAADVVRDTICNTGCYALSQAAIEALGNVRDMRLQYIQSTKTVSLHDNFMKKYHEMIDIDPNMAVAIELANRRYLKNLALEKNIWQVQDAFGHINGQGQAPISDMRLENANAGETSCEAISVYNVLKDLGVNTTLSDIMFTAEVKDYTWLYGYFGTKTWKVDDLLADYGVSCIKKEATDVKADLSAGNITNGQKYVASIWTDQTLPISAIHTFEITYNPSTGSGNDWTVYNRLNSSTGEENYANIDDVLTVKTLTGTVTGKYICLYEIVDEQ